MQPLPLPIAALAEAIGLTENAVYKLYRGINRIRPEIAERLERVTGINRIKWAWPADFGDPWEAWGKEGYPIRNGHSGVDQ